MKKIPFLAYLAVLLLGVYSSQGQAATFTDKTAFLNALPGAAGVLNFDSLAGGWICRAQRKWCQAGRMSASHSPAR